MARVVILKTGNTYPSLLESFGDFDSWFLAGLAPELDLHVVDVTVDDMPGKPRDWDGIVVTGSPAMVSDRAPWSERTAAWLAEAVTEEVPVLGSAMAISCWPTLWVVKRVIIHVAGKPAPIR